MKCPIVLVIDCSDEGRIPSRRLWSELFIMTSPGLLRNVYIYCNDYTINH